MAAAATRLSSWEELRQELEEWGEEEKEFIAFVKEELSREHSQSGEYEYNDDDDEPYEQAFLFIVAAKDAKIKYRKMESSEVKKQRISEFQNFCKIHPYLKEVDLDDVKPPNVLATVDSFEDMKTVTKDFMEKYGHKAIEVSVYFNGHGKSLDGENAQLSFKNPMKKEENLNTVLEDLNGILQASGTNKLPSKFNIVFCQCYGHKHQMEEIYDPRMHVICFTDDDKPKTRSRLEYHNRYAPATENLRVRFSHHVELEEYGKELAKATGDLTIS